MTPLCRVIAGSLDVTAGVMKRLISIEVVDEIGVKSDKLTIKLADHEGRLLVLPCKSGEVSASFIN